MPADLSPTPPRTADGMLELMAQPIFAGGLDWVVVDRTWAATRAAFERFSVRKVAIYGDADVQRILATPGVIANERKIRAVIGAAAALSERGRRHGSARRWLDGCQDHEERLAALQELPGLGPWGAYYVVAKVGYPVPPWAA